MNFPPDSCWSVGTDGRAGAGQGSGLARRVSTSRIDMVQLHYNNVLIISVTRGRTLPSPSIPNMLIGICGGRPLF